MCVCEACAITAALSQLTHTRQPGWWVSQPQWGRNPSPALSGPVTPQGLAGSGPGTACPAPRGGPSCTGLGSCPTAPGGPCTSGQGTRQERARSCCSWPRGDLPLPRRRLLSLSQLQGGAQRTLKGQEGGRHHLGPARGAAPVPVSNPSPSASRGRELPSWGTVPPSHQLRSPASTSGTPGTAGLQSPPHTHTQTHTTRTRHPLRREGGSLTAAIGVPPLQPGVPLSQRRVTPCHRRRVPPGLGWPQPEPVWPPSLTPIVTL